MSKRSPAELREILKVMLRESLRLGAEGAQRSRLLHAQGCADGFMRALVEAGICDHRELLTLVRDVRAESGGPATREVSETVVAA